LKKAKNLFLLIIGFYLGTL